MFTAIAIHHPKPEHSEDFLAFMASVEAGMQGTPGLIDIASWREVNGGRLVAISRWESQEAFVAALPRLQAIGGPETTSWLAQPDDILRLIQP